MSHSTASQWMYEFYAHNVPEQSALRPYADHVVKEIKTSCGWDADVQVHIEPVVKDKNIYLVSMTISGIGDSIVVQKTGRHVLSILRKVRKTVMRQIHRLHAKRVSRRRRGALWAHHFNWNYQPG